MGWPEELGGALPPNRDEPAQLRSDIVDELADHLTCAVNRERPQCGDDRAARRAALARFGNPAAIARRLWFDAMRGYVMTQRILLAAVLVAAAAFIGATAMAWMAFQENRAVNEALLARLESLAERPAVEAVSEWCKLTVRVTKGTEDGEPAVGYSVSLSGNAINPSQVTRLEEKVDGTGSVSFSPILAGEYRITASTPWGEKHIRSVTLLPGSDDQIHLLAPSQETPETKVAIRVEWPADLADRGLLLGLGFSCDMSTLRFGEWQWHPRRNSSHWIEFDPDQQRIVSPTMRLSFGTKHSVSEESVEQTQIWRAGVWKLHSVRILVLNRRIKSGVSLADDKYLKIADLRLDHPPEYDARPDEANTFTIELPETGLNQVRSYLAMYEAGRARPEGDVHEDPMPPATNDP